MGVPALRTGVTEEEYLAFERSSAEKHEYADGEVFAMSGGTAEHSAVTLNLLAELRTAIQGGGCRAFESNMRVHVPATGRYVYPDGSIACGRLEFKDDSRDTLLNPRVVLEVLSDSTEAYDRGDKFAGYRTIPSVAEYVIASQTQPRIEVFTRQPDESWTLRIFGRGEKVQLGSLGCAIEVDQVYRDVHNAAATA